MSQIEVNKIGPQCGTTLTVGCGAGQTVAVDANTVTIGRCGGTVALASGASQTGFGRTGTVDWQTGSIKTSTFTAVNGQGFFVDTNGGEVTANLPAGSVGAIVSFQDYRNNFQNNALTITPNGSEKINTGTGPVSLNTEGEGATLVYVDSTVGWRSIQDNQFADEGAAFIQATGGTITTVCTNFKVHTFTGPGSFVVTNAGAPAGSTTVDYLVVAAGGGGGGGLGGGGGAGGFRESSGAASGCYAASPLGSGVSALPVAVQSYPITVGGGGAGRTSPNGTGGSGGVSTFSTITSTGGGGGGTVGTPPVNAGASGGSGGGGGGQNPGPNAGAGNTPPVSPPQGNPGGVADPSPGYFGGGGGGATAAGNSGLPSNPTIAQGGAGGTSSINGTPTARAGGGGGGGDGPSKSGGAGGGGGGGAFPQGTGSAGTDNTGGGGGGGAGGGPTGGDGAAGGSGIVIIRYRFQ